MPRPPRDFQPGREYLIRQRGNNGNKVFHDENDKEFMRKLIRHYAEKFQVRITFCEFGVRSVRIAVIPSTPEGIPRFMQSVIGAYSRWHNKKYRRKGHLWHNRYIRFA